jgi:hypothetical protein
MRIRRASLITIAAIAAVLAELASAQQPAPRAVSPETANPPLILKARIALPGVYGRIDHYGWDSKRGVLIVSALGNNTVELINSWKRVNTITGLEHPQGSLYVPGVDRIVVSSSSGKVRFYDAGSYKLLKTIDFGPESDTDNLRYDPQSKRVYVGEEEGIAAIDPATMERVQEFKLGSHAESFQFEQNGSRIFVNLPDQESFGVIDRKTGAVKKWKIPGDGDSHTLALDEANRRLFTAALHPGRLTVVDSESGKIVANLPCVVEVDDLWYDASRKRLYAPGSGFIDVFQQLDPDHYKSIAHIAVGAGSGETSYYHKGREAEDLYISWSNMLPQGGSEVLIFTLND